MSRNAAHAVSGHSCPECSDEANGHHLLAHKPIYLFELQRRDWKSDERAAKREIAKLTTLLGKEGL